jgi:hypothetical protein
MKACLHRVFATRQESRVLHYKTLTPPIQSRESIVTISSNEMVVFVDRESPTAARPTSCGTSLMGLHAVSMRTIIRMHNVLSVQASSTETSALNGQHSDREDIMHFGSFFHLRISIRR